MNFVGREGFFVLQKWNAKITSTFLLLPVTGGVSIFTYFPTIPSLIALSLLLRDNMATEDARAESEKAQWNRICCDYFRSSTGGAVNLELHKLTVPSYYPDAAGRV